MLTPELTLKAYFKDMILIIILNLSCRKFFLLTAKIAVFCKAGVFLDIGLLFLFELEIMRRPFVCLEDWQAIQMIERQLLP